MSDVGSEFLIFNLVQKIVVELFMQVWWKNST
jgi:hypothetical protein